MIVYGVMLFSWDSRFCLAESQTDETNKGGIGGRRANRPDTVDTLSTRTYGALGREPRCVFQFSSMHRMIRTGETGRNGVGYVRMEELGFYRWPPVVYCLICFPTFVMSIRPTCGCHPLGLLVLIRLNSIGCGDASAVGLRSGGWGARRVRWRHAGHTGSHAGPWHVGAGRSDREVTSRVRQIYKDRRRTAMREPLKQDILRTLAALCELSPDVRVGQLLAHPGFLAEDLADRTLWDIEDAELLQVLEKHRADLSKRQPNAA